MQKKSWSIRRKIGIANLRLSNVKPCYEITRVMGVLDDISNWKASMFKSFALFFYTILEDLLPVEYFQHFVKLSYGMFILLQERISIEEIKKVGFLFIDFVKEMERLYGIEHIGINVHFLTHLSQSVLDWGCLWATSTFIPEWFNGELGTYFNGTQSVADQMAQNFLINHVVKDEAQKLLAEHSLPPAVSTMLIDLLHLPSFRNIRQGLITNDDEVELLGSSITRKVLIEEEVALLNLFINPKFISFRDSQIDQGTFYSRFKSKNLGSIFATSSYTKSPKRTNYFALMSDGNVIKIENLIHFKSETGPPRLFILGYVLGLQSKTFYLPKPIGEINFSVIPGMTTKFVGKGTTYVAYDTLDVRAKCVVSLESNLAETYIITALPNHFETD